MTPYTKTDHGVADGFHRFSYCVHGYLGDRHVFVSVNTNTRRGEVDWVSSGRDHTKEPSGVIAAECFAKALLEAVETARGLE